MRYSTNTSTSSSNIHSRNRNRSNRSSPIRDEEDLSFEEDLGSRFNPIPGLDSGPRVETESAPGPESAPEPELSEEQMLEQRILFTLKIFPRVSQSMLQAALGPHYSSRIWRPILEQLIMIKKVKRTQESHLSERGRWRLIHVISLWDVPIPDSTPVLKDSLDDSDNIDDDSDIEMEDNLAPTHIRYPTNIL